MEYYDLNKNTFYYFDSDADYGFCDKLEIELWNPIVEDLYIDDYDLFN